MKTIDWTRPLRPVGDHGYTILVCEINGEFTSGTLADTKGRTCGLFTWETRTGVLIAAQRRFPYSAWCAENVPVDPADSGETLESVMAKFDAYRERRLPKRAVIFSLEEVRVLMLAIADRDEALEEHKRLARKSDMLQRPVCGKGKHNIGANGMCVLCGLAGWEY